jgi:hypothetical protein
VIARSAALSLRLLRLGGRRAMTRASPAGIGIVVGTALLAVALGAVHGWDARDDRAGWRTGDVAAGAGAPVALLRTTVDAAAGRVVHRVDVAAVAPGAPAPPGAAEDPGPGRDVVLARARRARPRAPAGPARRPVPGTGRSDR